MDVFDLRARLVDDYKSYTRSFIKIRDPRIQDYVDSSLEAGAFWPEPLLQLNPTFLSGGTVEDLVEGGILHPECARIFRIDKSDTDHSGKQLLLHEHQRAAIIKAKEGKSYVLTSCTGSGKSLAYIVPIVDHVLRHGLGRGIQAIVVYPMNALANSQDEELKKFLEKGYPDGQSLVRFARYTGQEKGDAREAIRSHPPDVLLTNYMMLELLLTEAEGIYEGDFYSHRYFAAEGFLPGYNFPRLPLSAYVPGRRQRKGHDEFLSRPRFLAISEFGPGALVYHEGARYKVYKVNLDFGSDDIEASHELLTATMKRCPKCGYAHLEHGRNLAEVCDRCGVALDGSARIDGLVHLQNVSLRLAQRITCDEEERQKFGYQLVSSYRFPEIGGRLDRRDADVYCHDVLALRLSYGNATDLYRINLGWASQRGNAAPGFFLDLERGYWAHNPADGDDPDDPTAQARLQRVVPYVKDTKNALVLRFSTIQRLERDLAVGVSVFDRHRFTVVSTEFIKSPRHAEDFVLKCPEFVIVDEAHGCTLSLGGGRGRQQRFELLRRVSQDPGRHLVLVTATPHSGNEDAFRSLLSLLDAEFAELPSDPDRAGREGIRRKLARNLVQRRRADIRHYLETDTAFPERKDKEATYTFGKEYRALFDDILEFAREYASEEEGGQRRRRVRYWSALALLRCVSSSPAAAAATLRSRAAVDQVADEEVDDVGRRTVLDQGDDLAPKKKAIHTEWENARDRERVSRSRFAQAGLSPEAVAAELQSVRAAIGRSEDVARFFTAVLQAANVPVTTKGKAITVQLSNETPRALRQAIGRDESFTGRFDLPLQEGEIYLGRTSPVIEGLAGWTIDSALDPAARDARPVASRCGVASTSAVSVRTTLLVARFRYHLQIAGAEAQTILCEEIVPLACTGRADAPQWLRPEDGERLLAVRPERNLIPTAMDQQLGLLLPALSQFQAALGGVAQERAAEQLGAHERVREASRTRGRVTIQPVYPVDILGAYVLLPVLVQGDAR